MRIDKELLESIRQRLKEILFNTNTPTGRLFELSLMAAIGMSVFLVMLESVREAREFLGMSLWTLELIFTVIFTVEYVARLWVSENPRKYAFSFFGIVDLIAILPTYITILFAGSHSLMVIRALRLVRVFRILKLIRYLRELRSLGSALMASRRKILVFLFSLLGLVTVFGTLMFMVESPEAGFTSIPRSIYWAIVTLTTVGYGDIAPQTVVGQFLASLIMILGYSIIAVPTGIVGAELARHQEQIPQKLHECRSCGRTGHHPEANYCNYCGTAFKQEE